MLHWAKDNILKWTFGIAIISFLFGPFIQENFTAFLRGLFTTEQKVHVSVCTPLRAATLWVSSSDGNERKTHSLGQFPMLQMASVHIFNATGKPIPDSSVFVAPLNNSANYIFGTEFYTDNNLSAVDYEVTELDENAFRVDLGNFANGQLLVMEFTTLLPTTFVIEYIGATESERQVANAGTCVTGAAPDQIALPVDFYSRFDFPAPRDSSLVGAIEDVADPIGPIRFDVILDYDCGDGTERQVVPMGGQLEYCNIKLNTPPEQ